MNRMIKFLITLGFIVVLVGGFYLLSGWISGATGYVIKSDDANTLSLCFSERATVLYTSLNCPECSRQERELAEVSPGLRFVDCLQAPRECLFLSKLPAIVQNKNIYYGFKSLDEVRKIARC